MEQALVILCGGLSTRMHCDKTFLPFGNTTLIEYQIRRFRPCFPDIFLSVPGRAEHPADYEHLCGCPVVEDLFPRIGPMGGLYSAMRSLPQNLLFFTSVDLPFTDPVLARDMCAALADAPDRRLCVLRSQEGYLQPLFAVYKKSLLPRLEAMIADGDYAVRRLAERDRTLVPDVSLPRMHFFNMNDPQSYYFALRELASRRPEEFPPDFLTAAPQGNAGNIPVLSFTARSGTGKTTYLERLLPLLKREHLRVAVIKHDAHGFEIDRPGKDSSRLTQAGADHMILTSEDQTAAVITHRGQQQDLDSLINRIRNVDVILTEGYKLENQKKICLLRRGFQETPVGDQSLTVAYLADFPYEADVPVFDLNRPQDLLPFLKQFLAKERNRGR